MEPATVEMIASLLDPLYDAAIEPELWQPFLRRASRAFNAEKAAVVIHSSSNNGTRIFAGLGISSEAQTSLARFPHSSPWFHEIQKCKQQGWYAGSPEDVVPLEVFRRSRLYSDFFRRNNIEWAAAAVIFRPGEYTPALALTRPSSGLPFSTREKTALRNLAPHLGRVFRMHEALGSLRARSAAGQHALDLMGAACITLDSMARVVAMNRRAESLIGGDWLRLREHRLTAAVGAQQKLLDECLLQACACGEGKSTDPGEGALVLHSAQGRALYLSVLPYRANWMGFEERPSALLFITTPEEQGQGEHRLWQTMFGLSPAECRVAEAMKQGMEVGEISDSMRIKVDTVRYYQKCVYRKTGVRGQGQLLRLLARLPSSVPES
ncbi:MAG: helix-turn-helix transcriptional regulator [Acidobacteriota bacterium]|nr:helix-turn-helix transcriptional regulator [Acidobacteriota bacterium]